MNNKIIFGTLLIVISSLVFAPIINAQDVFVTASKLEISTGEVSFVCPINCTCDSAGNIIECAIVACPINCTCDSAGNIVSCEVSACPINCTCDSEGNIVSCEVSACPINCTCDSEGNIISCEVPACPINCTCDSEGNIISCEVPACPINCTCDSEGNVILCKSSVCPQGCVCKGNAITCPIKEARPTQSTISTATGLQSISIEKISESKIGLKSKEVTAETNGKLIIEESKLYLDTSLGKKQINILPEEVVSRAIEISKISEVEEIEIKEESTIPIYSIKGIKKARLFSIIPITLKIETKINAETSRVILVKKPWWHFLAW